LAAAFEQESQPILVCVMDNKLQMGGLASVAGETSVTSVAPVYSSGNGSKRSSGQTLPLSFAQQQIWLRCQMAGEQPLYNESVTLHLGGPVDTDALRCSLNEVVRRHEAWRTVFRLSDDQPMQLVLPELVVEIPMVDLTSIPEPERESQARRLATEQVRRPFDLGNGPLVRALLVRINERDNRLYLALHHIIFDGFSIYRLFPVELAKLYEAFSSGSSAFADGPEHQYSRFSEWQQQRVESHALETQFSYWHKQLRDLRSLQLPTDNLRPALPEFRGATHNFELPEELASKLKALSQRENATLYMTLMAAFATLLHRYSGQDDLVIGTPTSARSAAQFESTLGCFHNPLPLRVDLSGDPTFQELLRRVRDVTLDALSNSEVPFLHIARALQREQGINPPIQVSFSVSPSVHSLPLGWKLTQFDVETGASKFDLELEIDERDNHLVGRFTYDSDLFQSATITRMGGHLGTLLQAVLETPAERISRLQILTAGERQQILAEWNGTATEYPDRMCIHELIEAQVERSPGAQAVVHERDSLSYAELNRRANQLSHYLRGRGIGPETPVAICLPRCLELAIALLGILKAGGACMPLDPSYPRERLKYMLSDAQVPLLLTRHSTVPHLEDKGTEVVYLDDLGAELGRQSTENPKNHVTPENLAYIIYTSGSTGRPRGVLLTHGGLVNHNLAAIKLYDMTAHDRMLQFASISFDITIEEIFPTWMVGGCLVFRPEEGGLAIADFMELLRRQQITMVDLPTAYWHEWVNELEESRKSLPPSLRLVIVGGEKASLLALTRWLKLGRGRVRWVNTYGPTEGSVIATAHEPSPTADPATLANLPIGRPIANTKVYLLDRALNLVPVGVAGELHIGGPGVARGYLNRPELTAEKFIRDPFSNAPEPRLYKTGDLAKYLPNGDIEFVGRVDDQVKIRGFRVELGEIETALAKHLGIREAVVAVRQTAAGDKRVIAYFVPQPEADVSTSALRDYLKDQLPDYMVPSAFVKLESLPMTPNGKVDRRGLPAPEDSDFKSRDFVAPEDETERKLAKIWEDVLNIRPIGVTQNFFELGGHSMLAVRLMHRIEQTFGKRMPITTLFQAPRIEQLAKLLREQTWSPSWSSLIPIQPNGSKPPFYCVHGVGGTVLRYLDLAKCLGPDQPFYGLQAQGLDGKQPCLTRVEDMAALYLKEVRQFQPSGPYYLSGYSFGGSVALEMARQLLDEGEEIGLLVLFDTPAKHNGAGSALNALRTLPLQKKISYAAQKAPAAVRKIRRTVKGLMLPAAIRNVYRGCYQAAANYKVRPYPGPAVLFYAEEKTFGSHSDPREEWSPLILGGLESHEIGGHHGNIIMEPQAKVLAEKLRQCLSAAHSRMEQVPAGVQ